MTKTEFCPKCGNQTGSLSRVEMYEKDSVDHPLFFFVCNRCYNQIEKFLVKPEKFPGRRRRDPEYDF